MIQGARHGHVVKRLPKLKTCFFPSLFSPVLSGNACCCHCCRVKQQSELISASLVSLPTAPNTAPYGSTGSAQVPLACWSLILALSTLISAY
ncbi:unnamed protein product [Arctogadus glacialis]